MIKTVHTPWWIALPLALAASLAAGCAWLAFWPGEAAFAAAAEQGSDITSDARYLESQLLLATGKTEEARKTLDDLRRERADSPDFIYEALAKATALKGDLKGARSVLDAGLQIHADSVELLLAHAALEREAGNVNESIADLDRALKLAPHRQDVLEMLSELHLSRLISNPSGSEEEVKKLIRVYNLMLEARRGSERLVPLLVLSTLYQKTGEVEKAVQVSAEALQLNSHNSRIYEAHASALVAARRIDEAIAVYRRGLIQAPGDEDLRQKAEALLLNQGGEEGRAQFFVRLAADYPNNPAIQQTSAQVLMQAKRWADAERCLGALLQIRPGDIPNKLALLQVWLEMGRVQDAVAEAKKLGQTSGDLAPAITLSVAESLENQGHRREAMALLEDYNANHPLNENVALGLVSLLIEDKQSAKAVGLLEQVKTKAPGNFLAVALLAEIYANDDRFDDAIKLLDGLPEAIGRDHASDVALLRCGLYINQGIRLENKREHAAAGKLLQRAMDALDALAADKNSRVDPRRVLDLRTSVFLNQGLIAQKQGDHAAAEAIYRKALDMNPNDAETWNTLGYFYAETNQKLDEALTMVKKALELKPKAAHIVDSLGWVFFRQGRYEDAITQLEQATRDLGEDPDAAEVYDHLGDAYGKAGRPADARKAWQKALDLKGDLDIEPVRAKLGQVGQ